MNHNYPSNISREQFENIRALLSSCRKRTRPPTVDIYDIFCGILYILKGGVQWRMLPSDFPKWQLCYYYWSIWSEKQDADTPSIVEQCLKKIG